MKCGVKVVLILSIIYTDGDLVVTVHYNGLLLRCSISNEQIKVHKQSENKVALFI